MNIIIYDINDNTTRDSLALPELPFIPHESIVVVTGNANAAKYGLALSRLRKSPADMVVFKLPDQAYGVVVLSALPQYFVGEKVDLNIFFNRL